MIHSSYSYRIHAVGNYIFNMVLSRGNSMILGRGWILECNSTQKERKNETGKEKHV